MKRGRVSLAVQDGFQGNQTRFDFKAKRGRLQVFDLPAHFSVTYAANVMQDFKSPLTKYNTVNKLLVRTQNPSFRQNAELQTCCACWCLGTWYAQSPMALIHWSRVNYSERSVLPFAPLAQKPACWYRQCFSSGKQQARIYSTTPAHCHQHTCLKLKPFHADSLLLSASLLLTGKNCLENSPGTLHRNIGSSYIGHDVVW